MRAARGLRPFDAEFNEEQESPKIFPIRSFRLREKFEKPFLAEFRHFFRWQKKIRPKILMSFSPMNLRVKPVILIYDS